MKYFLMLIGCILLVACHKDCCDEPTKPTVSPASRTVIVYMAAENNISSYAQEDINEMIEGRRLVGDDANLVVFVDRASEKEYPFLIRITNSTTNPIDTIYQYMEDFLASDPSRFLDVLRKAIEYCPATKDYGLVLWGHANGWNIENDTVAYTSLRAPRRAYGIDSGDNSRQMKGTWMNIPSMRKALEQLSIKWKFIFCDCCNMQSAEVAFELRHRCDYLIASPAEITGKGAPYNTIVRDMFISDDVQMYTNLCDDYHAQEDIVGGHLPISAIKTAALKDLAAVTRDILPIVKQNLAFPREDIDNGHIYYYGHPKYQNMRRVYPQEEKSMYDMKDIIRWGLTGYDSEYKQWCDAFDKAIVYKKTSTFWHNNYLECNTSEKTFADFTVTEDACGGVYMFFPLGKYANASSNYNETCRKMAWYYAVGWND